MQRLNHVEEIKQTLQDNYSDKSYAWYTKEGQLASTTGNLYGIYDMNGGSSEYTAGYLEKTDEKGEELCFFDFEKTRNDNK